MLFNRCDGVMEILVRVLQQDRHCHGDGAALVFSYRNWCDQLGRNPAGVGTPGIGSAYLRTDGGAAGALDIFGAARRTHASGCAVACQSVVV